MIRWSAIFGATLAAGCDSGLTFYGDQHYEPLTETPDDTPPTASTAVDPTDPLSLDPAHDDPPVTVTPSTTTPPWANGDPTLPPPYSTVNPPDLVLPGPCLEVSTSVPDGSGEVVVESHDDNHETKELLAPTAGWFDLYDRSLANSGDDETNEIARVRVSNATWLGDSAFANCGVDWVGPDRDNLADPGEQLFYLGTFWFEATNTLQLDHFCPEIRAGVCPTLEDVTDPDSTCEAGDGNSAGLVATGLCLMEPTP